MVQLRAFPTTDWALKYYHDPEGGWLRVLDQAELGDLSAFREVYATDCGSLENGSG
ncbi:hypothetical protein [Microbacterium sp.]|uniref:hypothetical protein n=1 Tax=Microbacterium sp. TaxID=51671 RepID=UPI003A88F651